MRSRHVGRLLRHIFCTANWFSGPFVWCVSLSLGQTYVFCLTNVFNCDTSPNCVCHGKKCRREILYLYHRYNGSCKREITEPQPGFVCLFVCLFLERQSPPPTPQWAVAFSFTRFLDHTQRRTTVGRTPLGEWSARRRDLYVTTHNNRQTSMPLMGFEPAIPASERPQIDAVDRTSSRTGHKFVTGRK